MTALRRPAARLLDGALGTWRRLRPRTVPTCRFVPSCSEYAVEAVEARGLPVGAWLAARRLARCHPWGGMGYDPVPAPHPSRGPRV